MRSLVQSERDDRQVLGIAALDAAHVCGDQPAVVLHEMGDREPAATSSTCQDRSLYSQMKQGTKASV